MVLVEMDVQPGLGTATARLFEGVFGLLAGTKLERTFVSAAGTVLEEERMWTETPFLTAQRGTLLWYMEAADMDEVMEVYESTDNRMARWSEAVLNRLFETPIADLNDPMAASEYEVLAHATGPERRSETRTRGVLSGG